MNEKHLKKPYLFENVWKIKHFIAKYRIGVFHNIYVCGYSLLFLKKYQN